MIEAQTGFCKAPSFLSLIVTTWSSLDFSLLFPKRVKCNLANKDLTFHAWFEDLGDLTSFLSFSVSFLSCVCIMSFLEGDLEKFVQNFKQLCLVLLMWLVLDFLRTPKQWQDAKCLLELSGVAWSMSVELKMEEQLKLDFLEEPLVNFPKPKVPANQQSIYLVSM